MLKYIALALLLVVALGVALVYSVGMGVFGAQDGRPIEIQGATRPDEVQRASEARVRAAADGVRVPRPKQILFGDFHVHTTISFDAFMISLPSLNGEGAHPPADACDFARYCSALDFWSINDHAESISSPAWQDTIDAVRACNARAGDPLNPDMVSFLGWEWTQVGATPDTHYGHKNVVLPGLADDEIPRRPIGAARALFPFFSSAFARGWLTLSLGAPQRMHTFSGYWAERAREQHCAADVNTRALPGDCVEVAETPAVLFRKLGEWGFDSLVIPHGTTWGFYTPPGSTWDKQLSGALHDPQRQTLLEVYSGHGDSEVYRSFEALAVGDDGEAYCPAPTDDYLPTCWRAGEIIRERCESEGLTEETCAGRAERTRKLAAQAGQQAHLVVVGGEAADWLDAGQCRDCDQPAFNYRPGGSAQYLLALGNFDDDPAAPKRFRLGFISSSDNHYARPGTGFKEKNRRGNTESNVARLGAATGLAAYLRAPVETPESEPRPFDLESSGLSGFQLYEMERQASFFITGGLVATHAEGRSRSDIWDAIKRREVYATSGPRLLLWFDLLNPEGGAGESLPMGGETALGSAPIFQARAVGSFEQKPGCPDYAAAALPQHELERLCKGECYNPSDKRRRITRIEVVRVRPQLRPDEDVATLIDDPWMSFPCTGDDPAGCTFTFTDAEFPYAKRDAVYYVRAYEAPTPGINAGNVNCEYDAEGRCVKVDLCDGADDCLASHEPRAWSSPIYVNFAGPGDDGAAESALASRSASAPVNAATR